MENQLITIPTENIICEFELEDNHYCAFSETEELIEGENMYFAKMDELDDEFVILRNIESDEEYARVLQKYNEITNLIGDEDYEY